ncbi:RsmF rRNA methyltransferase first C-terminal domain-containing protein [Brevibacillus sp. B_LB10_24]|uniref:RsmF rRNA methyltransferase first C-terminal domain-containing protein n=1 Tax=Brevibacillus sp. B_LB10_24 TaxID=3380645 RepID=UPI0038B8228E
MNLIPLPPLFQQRMKELLQGESDPFFQSYQEQPWHGLRVNSLKVDPELFRQISPVPLRPIPWCGFGFTYPHTARPGKHPFHAAGLYYIQEPSAMAVAAALDAQPGERVLDLCAAPGGKSTQIAAALAGDGLLIANEIHPVRAKALSENIERMGVANALVVSETPERLAARFPQYFDRILVDAPCSGEGMFRKLPEACADWSPEKVSECHMMQTQILQAAAQMLKPGGILVYSTCTFAPLENEQTIETFLAAHPEFELQPVAHREHFAPGRPEWSESGDRQLRLTARLWPHLLTGEGHFIARLQKQTDAAPGHGHPEEGRIQHKKKGKAAQPAAAVSREALALWQAFADETLPGHHANNNRLSGFTLFGDQLYALPDERIDLGGLKVLRPGLHLGTVKKQRFEPAHALALACKSADAARTADFPSDSTEVLRYLKGESLACDGKAGWTLATVDGFSLGWGKQSGGQLKNHYPKGLRWT